VEDDPELLADNAAVEKVLSGLLRLENYHVAGELCQSQGNPGKAMELYCKGNIYAKAVELARFVSPGGKCLCFRDVAPKYAVGTVPERRLKGAS